VDGPSGRELPTGTVTFLFTDIEGSTRLLQELGDRWGELLEEHNRVLRGAIREAGGVDLRTEGDAFFAVFGSAPAAVRAAAAAQEALAHGSLQELVRVRMGLHTGEGIRGGDDYVGLDAHRAARIASAAHGGQVLISSSTRALVDEDLPAGVTVRGLGRHRLKDIPHPEVLSQLVIAGLPSTFPPPHTLEVPSNLPAPLTSFVGRSGELARVRGLLGTGRLLTLTGAGGTGKTRLALEAAGQQIPEFPGGVFFVELAPIEDPDLVASAIAQALGVREEPARPILDTLKDDLAERQLLLLLDNFEQILPAAPVIADLLTVSKGLKVLVTSRAGLHLRGEQEFTVPPLRLPEAPDLLTVDQLSEYEAVTLFVQRARALDPEFAITEENARVVAQICARLDGLPLAIELAASRIKLLAPSAMLERLEHRLALLTGGARDLPSRQRTLRETIGWSYDLLRPHEQTFFSRLAVFVGGWTIEAADAVANPDEGLGIDTLDVVGSLVDKSLVGKEVDTSELRFGMLETIREYSAEQLEETEAPNEIRRRHAAYFLDMAEAAEAELTRRDLGWLDRLEREHDNIRAALQWAMDAEDVETGLRMTGALWRFWQMRDHLFEGRRWTEELLAFPAAARRTAARAKALLAAGSLAYWQRDTEPVRKRYEEGLAIYRELGDRRGEAEGAYNLAFGHLLSGDLAGARRLHLQAAKIYRELNDPIRLAYTISALGMVTFLEGDLEETGRLIDEARRIFVDVGDLWGIALTSGQIGALAMKKRDYDRARSAAIDSLDANVTLGNTLGLAVAVQALAVRAIHLGRPETGVRLAGAADRVRQMAGGEPPSAIVGLEDPRDLARESLTEERIAALWEEGRATGFDEMIASARRET
jgi:predicted ATPase/class 3 adenylate cyclase